MSGAIYEVPIEWDILVSASDACLKSNSPGFVGSEIIRQLPSSITYRLWHENLGELGTLEIRRLRPGLSEIRFSGISTGAEDTALIWSASEPDWKKKINEAMKGLPEDQAVDAYQRIRKERDGLKAEIRAKQIKYLRRVMQVYLGRLDEERIWPRLRELTKTVLLYADQEVFFNWLDKTFVHGMSFGFGESWWFMMSTGAMVPLRTARDTFEIVLGEGFARNSIKFIVVPTSYASNAPIVRIDATCKANMPELLSAFEDVWNEILRQFKRYDENALERSSDFTVSNPAQEESERPLAKQTGSIRAGDGRRLGKSGRPHLPDDLWAWEEVNKLNRPLSTVYKEWLRRDGVRARNLQNPKRQFNRITKPGWRTKSGQNI